MCIETLNHSNMSCEIEQNNTDGHFTWKLKYRAFNVGLI